MSSIHDVLDEIEAFVAKEPVHHQLTRFLRELRARHTAPSPVEQAVAKAEAAAAPGEAEATAGETTAVAAPGEAEASAQ